MTGRDGDWRLALAFGIVGAIAYSCSPSLAQITPDATLGAESSVITPNANVGGFPADLIQGGATRGANLFHSFDQFNVGNGQRVYFANPVGIEAILTRVTGNTFSNILGTLGVNGGADLFLLNPNGIIFGSDARLDVGGSFVATTANAIQFGEQGFFSATNPETPGLLTINPSAFFFNQLSAGTIINQSVARNPIFPSLIDGLRVPIGENLVLLGGNVNIDGGQLNTFGGRVEIGAVTGQGTLKLNPDGSLSFPSDLPRADVSLFNAGISVAADNGGSVAINARNLNILGNSEILAGIEVGVGTVDSQAGDISLNAIGMLQIGEHSRISNIVRTNALGNSGDIRITAGSLSLTDGARLRTTLFGQGNAGDILIETSDQVSLDNGAIIFGNVEETGIGNGGTIRLNTSALTVDNDAVMSTSISGRGNAGDILINARARVSGKDMRIFSGVQESGIGNGGTIRINTGTLSLTDNAFMSAFTVGQGNAGDIVIEASDRVSLDKSANIFSFGDSGIGGNIRITTGSVSVDNDAELRAITYGHGGAGNVIINALDQISLNNGGRISSQAAQDSTGNGGDVHITAGSLLLSDRAQLATVTYGQGNAGDVIINARDQVSLNNSAHILSNIEGTGNAEGGDIRITTGLLTVTNLAVLQAGTAARGNAGSIIINARDRVTFDGGTDDGLLRSSARSIVEKGAVGNSGNVEITTGSLAIINRALVSASTRGQGNAGNVIINARDNVSLDNMSTIFSAVDENAVGRGGDINITTGSLSLTNGGQLDASTFGQGNSGNITVTARDTILIDGISLNKAENASTIFTEVFEGAQGDGGNIQIFTASLLVTNEGQLDAKTRGQGNAGSIFITARDTVLFDGGSPNGGRSTRALSSVEENAVGIGGNIEITTGSLRVSNGAQLLANTLGQGDAGSVIINARDSVTFDGSNGQFPSAAFSSVNEGGVGKGGNIEITARSLSVTNGAAVSAITEGQGNAGHVMIAASDRVLLDGVGSNGRSSGIFTDTQAEATGQGGTITVQTNTLSLSDRAQISARSGGTGDAGSVAITADEAVRLTNSDITTSAEQAAGGAISITTDSLSLNRGRITAATGTTGAQGAANITLQGIDLLLMGNESLISANALNQANGGNVTIDSTLIVATPPEGQYGSDITANASRGNGGRVSITTQGLFGIEFRPALTPDNDITVSSEFGLAGEFALNQPEVDPSRGLAELPSNLVDAERQIDRTCTAGGAATRSSFVVTGRGGIPPAPTDPLDSPAIVSEWVTLAPEEENVNTVAPDANPTSTAPKPLVEAQGWVKTPDGSVMLVAEVPSATPGNPWLTSPTCQDMPAKAN